jgi:hypothetical protein
MKTLPKVITLGGKELQRQREPTGKWLNEWRCERNWNILVRDKNGWWKVTNGGPLKVCWWFSDWQETPEAAYAQFVERQLVKLGELYVQQRTELLKEIPEGRRVGDSERLRGLENAAALVSSEIRQAFRDGEACKFCGMDNWLDVLEGALSCGVSGGVSATKEIDRTQRQGVNSEHE